MKFNHTAFFILSLHFLCYTIFRFCIFFEMYVKALISIFDFSFAKSALKLTQFIFLSFFLGK